jgi:diaminopimelate decarboxylase
MADDNQKSGCIQKSCLFLLAQKLHLEPSGVSFHVGSQQRDIGAWDSSIAKARYIFNYLKDAGVLS